MEILGVIASIIVLISFLTQDVKKIRIINIVGCICFVIYGITINAFSVWFLNGMLCLIHIWKLLK